MSMPSHDYAHFRAELPQELSQEAKSSHVDYDLSRSWPGVHRGSWVAVVRGCCCSCLSRMDSLDYEFHSYPSAFVSASGAGDGVGWGVSYQLALVTHNWM